MAEIIWGLATSHVPSIGAAMDNEKTEDDLWKPLFDGYAPPGNGWLSTLPMWRSSSTTTMRML
ncbi:hypothetical protein [Nesterenkonia pannonica]|uniref:hypothetical protein n=1 Tax=Nesterenkonia pannonica TaxID=1548602 RepID=UPI0021646731|nr:hypothetical protein [Nesterenkonia pannonica]